MGNCVSPRFLERKLGKELYAKLRFASFPLEVLT